MEMHSRMDHGEVSYPKAFNMRSLKVFSSESNTLGAVLNITRISRKHMGVYLCEANNGIPPASARDFEIEVHCKKSN